jgi:hypothetical protein
VPCKPCDGLIPGDDPNPDDCKEPPREGCDPDELRKQLDAVNRCITSEKAKEAELEKKIADRENYRAELKQFIDAFETFIKNYSDKWHDLKCREQALKSFYRDTAKDFQDPYKFPEQCLRDMQKAINDELCDLERTKCCLKNLDGKLGKDSGGKPTKVTKLLWEQQRASERLEKSNKALDNLKTFGDWIDGQFKALEKLRDGEGDKPGITKLLCSSKPEERNVAFYRFFWEFAPKLCKRFPVAICCKDDDCGQPPQYPPGQQPPPDQYGQQPPNPYPGGQPQPPGYGQPGQPPAGYPTQPPQGGYGQPPTPPPHGGYGPPPTPPPQGGYGPPPTQPPPGAYGQPQQGGYNPPQYQNPAQNPNPQYPPGQYPPQPPTPKPPTRIGCEPGDWHPSAITVDELKQLVCCAWDEVRKKRDELADADNAVARAESNQKLISEKATADEATLESRIETKVKKVKCQPGGDYSSSR